MSYEDYEPQVTELINPRGPFNGEKIREGREARGFTRKDLAKLVNVTVKDIKDTEEGRCRFGYFKLNEIANVLRVQFWFFYLPSEPDDRPIFVCNIQSRMDQEIEALIAEAEQTEDRSS